LDNPAHHVAKPDFRGVWEKWNPLFEILRKDGESLTELADRVIEELSDACANGDGATLFIDFNRLTLSKGDAPVIERILNSLKGIGLFPAPVINLKSVGELKIIDGYCYCRWRTA
jgi:hypothetical protein